MFRVGFGMGNRVGLGSGGPSKGITPGERVQHICIMFLKSGACELPQEVPPMESLQIGWEELHFVWLRDLLKMYMRW